MKLRNNGSEQEILYDGQDYIIPAGDFEIKDVGLSYFIQRKATHWGLDIVILSEDEVKVKGTDEGVSKKLSIKSVGGASSKTLPGVAEAVEEKPKEKLKVEAVKEEKPKQFGKKK